MRRRVIELDQGRIVRDEATRLLRAERRRTPPSSARCCASRAPEPRARDSVDRRHRRDLPGDEARLLHQARRCARSRATPIPSFAAMASRARHGARARRLHPGRPGDDRRGQRGPRPRARRRLPQDATPTSRTSRACSALLDDDADHVGKVEFVSKAQAYAQEKQAQPRGLRAARVQPAARHVPRHARQARQRRRAARRAGARSPPAARARRSTRDRRRSRTARTRPTKILTATRVVKLAMGAAGVLLVIASVLLISNTIRLSLFSRRREVEVMKLVGATDWFIRWPFVIEGVVLGALGGVLAVLLLGDRQDRVPRSAGVGLRADRRAARRSASPLLVALLLAASVARLGRRARACRCAGSCASRRGLAPDRRGLRALRMPARSPLRRVAVRCRRCCLVLLARDLPRRHTRRACPGSSATRSWATSDTRVVARRSTTIHDTTTARSPTRELADDAVKGIVAALRRPLLQLLHAQGVRGTSRSQQSGSSPASASRSPQDPRGPADRRGLRRLAGQARRAAGRAT